jgi:hypothetical protein
MSVTIVEGNLLDQHVDVIVNAWNRNIIPWWLLLPQGVSRAIKKRGGTGPFKELRKHGPIPVGGAVMTSAGRLPFKAIIQHDDLMDGLRALGLVAVTVSQVESAVKALYPSGVNEVGQGEALRAVFLHLRAQESA